MGGLLLVGGFLLISIPTEFSPPMTAFPLPMQAREGLGTVCLTNTVFEVVGISKVEATYLSLVLSVGHF
jgi:hypothetical protein